MSKWNAPKEEQKDIQWKPSAREAQDLSEKLKAFTVRTVNARMQYPFQLYLESEDMISFSNDGYMQVKNPFQYHRLNEINSLREWINEQEQERYFINFPDAREEFEAKRKEWMMDIRAMFSGMGDKLKAT